MFSGFVVTNAGKALLAKALVGEPMEFTRAQIGSGELAEGVDIENVTDLVSPIKYLPISNLYRERNMASVAIQIMNAGTEGFTLREVGLFAKDPDDGEILYAYSNAGADADVVPKPSVSVVDYVMTFDLLINSYANVTAQIDTSAVFATQEYVENAIKNVSLAQIGAAAEDHEHDAATQSDAGFMSPEDKTKLDGVAAGANKYVHPTHAAKSTGLYKIEVDGYGHVVSVVPVNLNDITTLGAAAATHDHNAATQSAAGFMSATDKAKLDGVATGANKYVHPSYTAKSSGLYKITVDSTGHVSSVVAATINDLTALGAAAEGHEHETATQSKPGFMSAADKSKLDGVEEGANKYAHPTHTAKSSGLYKIAIDGYGHVSAADAAELADLTALGVAEASHDHNAATQSKSGFMGATDKAKLDGIAAGANKYTHPSYTSRSSGLYKVTVDSTGHISAVSAITLADLTALGTATTSSAGFMSSDDKSKLDGVATGANNYTHPTHTAKSSGLYKITVDSNGHVSAATAVTISDLTALGAVTASHDHNAATQSAAGFMSATDKTKLDGIATGANKYTHPSYTARSAGLYKITVDASGHVSAVTAAKLSDLTALGAAAAANVVSKSGDTMTGALAIAPTSGGGSIGLAYPDSKYSGRVVKHDHAVELQAFHSDSEYRGIRLYDSDYKENNFEALVYSAMVDGKWTSYRLYGEHNKPTVFDVNGALSAGGGMFTATPANYYTDSTLGELAFYNGKSPANGAGLWLYGNDHTYAGQFRLQVCDAAKNYRSLIGKPDGSLTWGGRGIALVPYLLWSNASVTSSFAAQTLTMNLADFAFVMIVYRYATDSSQETIVIARRATTYTRAHMHGTDGVQNNYICRDVAYVAGNTGLKFTDAYSGGATKNTVMIPVHIYGLKG